MNKEDDHVDYFGQPIAVGDLVVAAVGGSTHNVEPYQIKKFVYTRYHDPTYGGSLRIVNLELQRHGMKIKRTSVRTNTEVVKINPSLLTYKTLLTPEGK